MVFVITGRPFGRIAPGMQAGPGRAGKVERGAAGSARMGPTSGGSGGAPPGKAHPARRLFKRLRKPPHRPRPWAPGESRPQECWTGANR
jgi:hypothetical protein